MSDFRCQYAASVNWCNQAIAQVCGAPWKALVLSGCESRPGAGSLHPVAIRAATEETKSSEPLV